MKLNTGLLFSLIFLSICWIGCNSQYQVLNSQNQVTNLKKDGCLFVRLHYFPNKIAKLNEMGYKAAAVVEQKKIAEANKSMMSAFKKNWDFSPVYFIFPEESMKIKESNFENINLLNESLEVDSNLKCNCDYALVVEEGRMTTDTTQYFEDALYNPSTKKYESEYHTDTSQNIQGLMVKSNEFIQLHKPFPFYTRRYKFFFERSDEAMVDELNTRFHTYFNEITK